MGEIADALRASLRELAQADARLYRGLQQELGDPTPATKPPAALLDGDAPARRDELERLSVAVLWTFCKGKGIKGLSNGPKPKQIDALLSHPVGPPVRSELPLKAIKGSKGGATRGRTTAKAGASDLQGLEQRLDRLEQLVLLIAQQVGVPHEAIERLLPPAAPEP
jgi:hypothetical protein